MGPVQYQEHTNREEASRKVMEPETLQKAALKTPSPNLD